MTDTDQERADWLRERITHHQTHAESCLSASDPNVNFGDRAQMMQARAQCHATLAQTFQHELAQIELGLAIRSERAARNGAVRSQGPG